MATEEDRIDTGVLLTIGAVLTIAVVGVALAVTALVRSESEQLTAEKGATANLRPLQELRREQSAALEGKLPKARQAVLDEIKADPNKATEPTPLKDAGAKETPDAGAATDTADAGEQAEAAAPGEETDKQPGGEPPTGEAPTGDAPKPPKAPKAPPAPAPPAPEPEPEAP